MKRLERKAMNKGENRKTILIEFWAKVRWRERKRSEDFQDLLRGLKKKEDFQDLRR